MASLVPRRLSLRPRIDGFAARSGGLICLSGCARPAVLRRPLPNQLIEPEVAKFADLFGKTLCRVQNNARDSAASPRAYRPRAGLAARATCDAHYLCQKTPSLTVLLAINTGKLSDERAYYGSDQFYVQGPRMYRCFDYAAPSPAVRNRQRSRYSARLQRGIPVFAACGTTPRSIWQLAFDGLNGDTAIRCPRRPSIG